MTSKKIHVSLLFESDTHTLCNLSEFISDNADVIGIKGMPKKSHSPLMWKHSTWKKKWEIRQEDFFGLLIDIAELLKKDDAFKGFLNENSVSTRIYICYYSLLEGGDLVIPKVLLENLSYYRGHISIEGI